MEALYPRCSWKKEGALPVGTWKTSWQRKHYTWTLEKEAGRFY